MVPIHLDHTFDQTPNLHLHTGLIEQLHIMPSNNKYLVINMGRYQFYDKSPNEYCFTDGDLGLTIDKSNFDQYDFYYNLEELQEPADPSMMDDDSIYDMQSPTSQRWIYFLHNTPAQCDDKMSTPFPDMISYATKLEAELDCTIHTIQLWGEIDTTHWYLTHPPT